MPHMKDFKTGMFSWSDLSTTDVAGAKRFYGELLGWSFEDMPAGGGHLYSMARRDGEYVAAASELMAEQRQRGVPPHWMAYITVENVDAAAKKVEALGGKLVAPPFDVLDAGRMCVVQDPTGAMVSLWQATGHKGAGLMREPGALAWFELMTTDPAKAQDFYTQLAGWTTKTMDMGTMQYTVAFVGEADVAGMMKADANVPSHWLVYFTVADCDASAAKAGQLGAKTHVPPTDIPDVGRFSVLQDPQGAYFALVRFKA